MPSVFGEYELRFDRLCTAVSIIPCSLCCIEHSQMVPGVEVWSESLSVGELESSRVLAVFCDYLLRVLLILIVVFRRSVRRIPPVLPQVFRMFVLRVMPVLGVLYCSYSQFSQYLGLQYCSCSQYSQYLGRQFSTTRSTWSTSVLDTPSVLGA